MTAVLPDQGPQPGEVWQTSHGVRLRQSGDYFRLDYVLGGRRRQPSVGRDWRNAWQAACAADMLLAAEAGDLAALSVHAMCDAWVAARARDWSPRYQEQVNDTLTRFVHPTVGHLACADLRKSHLREAIAAGSTPAVRRVTRSVLSSLVSWAQGDDWLDAGRGYLPPAERGARGPSEMYVPLDETPETADVLRLTAACRQPRPPKAKHGRTVTPPEHLYLMVLVAGFCGLRQGEVLALRGGDIHDRTLHVRRQVQELRGKGLTVLPPKSGRERQVVIPKQVGSYPLADLLDERAHDVGKDGLLFPGRRGGFWRKGNFNAGEWAVARKSAEFRWTFHDLRHHYCRWLLSRGVEPKDVSLMAGHASVTTTLNLYVGHSAWAMDRVRDAVG